MKMHKKFLLSHVNRKDAFQKGVGALEYIGIALFFVVILGGVLARTFMLNNQTSNVAENAAISSLYQAVKTNLKSNSGYGTSGTDLIATLNQTQGLPKNLTYDGTSLDNTYGKAYTLVSTGTGFTLTDPGISEADCIKIVVQQSSNGSWDGGVSAGSGSASTSSISTADAATMCSSTSNTITLTSTY